MENLNLLSFPTLVETPFIIAKIGKYTFGNVGSVGNKVTFPNFMTDLTVTKYNGDVNLYELQMTYQISAGDDPNMLDHVFSEVGYGKIIFSYGDWSYPSHIYKEEEALITNVKSSINVTSSSINYTISATSTAIKLSAVKRTFPQLTQKGSTMLLDLISDKRNGITEVFQGMANKELVIKNNLIPTDDTVVTVEQLTQGTVMDRLNQIVNSMKSASDPNAVYGLTIIDDNRNEMNGPYFKVSKVTSSNSQNTEDNVYSIDVGYPGENFVTNFSLQNDLEWSLVYQTSKDSGVEQYIKRIDNLGKVVSTKSLSVTRNSEMKTNAEDEAWWKQVTEFPLNATLDIKGLVRPSMLMQYVRINTYFFGQKHISSGLYTITKQVDKISSNGYKTTLTLLRVKGDT